VVFEVCAAWLASWFILYFSQTTQLKRKKRSYKRDQMAQLDQTIDECRISGLSLSIK